MDAIGRAEQRHLQNLKWRHEHGVCEPSGCPYCEAERGHDWEEIAGVFRCRACGLGRLNSPAGYEPCPKREPRGRAPGAGLDGTPPRPPA